MQAVAFMGNIMSWFHGDRFRECRIPVKISNDFQNIVDWLEFPSYDIIITGLAVFTLVDGILHGAVTQRLSLGFDLQLKVSF